MTSNWGRWGADDQAGALNLLSPDVVTAAIAHVQSGEVVSLAQPFGPDAMSAPHRRAPARFMDRTPHSAVPGTIQTGGFEFAEDTVQFASHSSTHMDALSHVWQGHELYNGHPVETIRARTGAAKCGAENLTPIVTRGILIDVTVEGGPLLPSEAVTADMLDAALSRSGLELRQGDAVLVRTGWWEQGLDRFEYHQDEPGLDLSAAQRLAGADVVLVGADNYAIEQQPSPDGDRFPVHLCLLHQHGVPLLENLDLSRLARTGRSEFLFVATPLPMQGSTASPVAPIAIL